MLRLLIYAALLVAALLVLSRLLPLAGGKGGGGGKPPWPRTGPRPDTVICAKCGTRYNPAATGWSCPKCGK